MLALVAVIAMGFVAGGTWRASMPASLGAGACGAAFAPTIVRVNVGSSITIGGADGHSYNDLRARGAWLDDRLRTSVDVYLPFLPAVQDAEIPAMIGYGVDLVRGRLLSPLVGQTFAEASDLMLCTSREGPIWWTAEIE